MYKFERYRQLGLEDFDQPAGLKMDPDNRWVRKAATIPWEAIEEKYAELFPVIRVCRQSRSAQHGDS